MKIPMSSPDLTEEQVDYVCNIIREEVMKS